MGRARDLIIDAWSSLSHKAPLRDDAEARINGWTAKSWVDDRNRRRLTAYTVLAAYEANVSREFLSTTDDSDRDERREYGDAGLIIDQVLSHLLGEDQEVVVPGAEDYDPTLDEEPAEGETDQRDPDELAANARARALVDRQDFLREWADDVHLQLRLTDCERDTVKYGDGAWLLGWDDAKQRVVPTVMDPGFYFPVLPDTLDAYEYPERVHFAWEIPAEDFPDNKVRVRRLTYELRPLQPVYDEEALVRASSDEEYAAAITLPDGARWETGPDGEQRLVRDYPWHTDPSEVACYLTDATWILDDLKDAHNVDAFDLDQATFRHGDDGEPIRDLDLGIDFLPVIHEPNTPPGGDHFGQSSLARVLQLLDDLQNADTDAQAAAATTGSPIIGISGTATGGDNPLTGQRGQTLEVRPGAAWRLGTDGRLDTVDTSGNLAATREYVHSLRERLATNARLPAAVLGMLDPSEVPSGYAMQLSFGPLSSMIRQMRLVRAVKHPLLLKMVQRLYQANGVLEPGPTPRAEITLGAFLPSDQAGILSMVKDAYEAGLISLETAVGMLLEAGFTIDDVSSEIDRITSRDFEGANRLADATNDNDAVREYLGMEPADQAVPPVELAPPGEPIAGGTGTGVPSSTDRRVR